MAEALVSDTVEMRVYGGDSKARYMSYCGTYTRGESWIRGSYADIVVAQGGQLNTEWFGFPDDEPFHMLLSGEEAVTGQMRGVSMDEVVKHIETDGMRFTNVAHFMKWAREEGWNNIHDESIFGLWEPALAELFAAAPNPVIVQTARCEPHFFYANYAAMIQELHVVSALAKKHDVTFHWI